MRQGVINNTIDDANRGSTNMYVDQVVVNAHSVLASTGQDTWLLSIDIDEFLILDQPRNLRTVLTECLNGTTSMILQVPAFSPNSTAVDGDLPFWVEASTHPLLRYVQQKATQQVVKSLMRPDDVVSFGVHRAFLRHGEELSGDVAAGCGLNLLHIENMHKVRRLGGEGNKTGWQWVLN